jgi:hypothetical protein
MLVHDPFLTMVAPLLLLFTAEALSVKHLSSTIECLRSFQAAQRFRKGVNAGNYTAYYSAVALQCCSGVCWLFGSGVLAADARLQCHRHSARIRTKPLL